MTDDLKKTTRTIRLLPSEVASALFEYLRQTGKLGPLNSYDVTVSFDDLRKGWNGINEVEVHLNWGEAPHVQ